MEIRITNLEERQHDTKPIWERALAEIAEARLESRTDNEVLRTEMKAGFAGVHHMIEHELRGVARKIDVLNQTFLQIQADQRYVDSRLEELETQTKET